MKKTTTAFLAVLLMLCGLLPACGSSEPLPQQTPLQQGESVAVMETSKGTIKLRFFPDEAPLAVENFLTLAQEGYYDGVSFHRVMAGFKIGRASCRERV